MFKNWNMSYNTSQHVSLYTRGVNTALATLYKALSSHNPHNNKTRKDMVLLDVHNRLSTKYGMKD